MRERIRHAEVQRVDHDVVDVEQHAAAGAPAQLREELRLGDRVVGERQVSRQVLDQDSPAQALLHLRDVAAEDVERLVGERDRQQVVGMQHRGSAGTRRAREAGVVGDARRLDALREARQPIEMPRVDAGGRAEREADAVQAHVIALACCVQHCERSAAVGKEILRMDFDEAERRRAVHHLGIVRLAQADACALRCHRGARHGLLLDRGHRLFGVLAAQLGAGALGDVAPFVGTHVGLVLAGARVRARQVRAIVLAGLGNAVALFLAAGLLVSGVDAGQQAEGQHGREGRRGNETLVHQKSPVLVDGCDATAPAMKNNERMSKQAANPYTAGSRLLPDSDE